MIEIAQRKLRFLVQGLAFTVAISLIGQGLPSWARFVPPENIGKAANREGAATRGGSCRAKMNPPLTALVPKSNVGLTTSAYPSFYWYMPEHSYKLASFTVYELDSQQQQEIPVYSSIFQISGTAGVASLALPAETKMPPLKVGKDYRWKLVLICNPNEPSGNIFVDGWVNRVKASASLTRQLASAKAKDRFEIYANAGLWHDALKVLVTLRQSNPQDPTLAQAWKALLESEPVQLDRVVTQVTQP